MSGVGSAPSSKADPVLVEQFRRLLAGEVKGYAANAWQELARVASDHYEPICTSCGYLATRFGCETCDMTVAEPVSLLRVNDAIDEMRTHTMSHVQRWRQAGWLGFSGRVYGPRDDQRLAEPAGFSPLWVLVDNDPAHTDATGGDAA